MSLTRLKNSILRTAAQWDGMFEVSDMPGTGPTRDGSNRFGRLSKSVLARRRRVREALLELQAEGRMVPSASNLDRAWYVVVDTKPGT